MQWNSIKYNLLTLIRTKGHIHSQLPLDNKVQKSMIPFSISCRTVHASKISWGKYFRLSPLCYSLNKLLFFPHISMQAWKKDVSCPKELSYIFFAKDFSRFQRTLKTKRNCLNDYWWFAMLTVYAHMRPEVDLPVDC